MDEYLERVARVLDVEPRTSALPQTPTLPLRRERLRPLPELGIGILEFFSLYGCELQQVVGQKNSALGRVMQPAQRLQYEVNFIRSARDCLPTISDESFRSELSEAIAVKREAFPRVAWNATWGTTEVAAFVTRSDGYLPRDYDADALRTLVADLGRLNSWLESLSSSATPAMAPGLSDIHQRWQAMPLAGQLIQSARLLIARLGDVEALIRQRLEGRPLCFRQEPNQDAEIMRNMFFNVYAGQVQPYMAQVQRVRASLLPALAELARRQQAVAGDAFLEFQRTVLEEGPGSLWHQLDEATRSHTERWQELLDQCGMRPQA